MSKFKDAEHLLRLAALFVVGFLIFIAVRAYFVPKTFAQYGHYRGAALSEIASREPKFAGQQACSDCHSDVLDVKKSGKHAGVHCEACHGAQGTHAADPTSIKPQLPDTAVLCARCHEQRLARPVSFPQVKTKDHSGGEPCKTCHNPHTPSLAQAGSK